jgi:cyclic dehypoxanthinyl futalosine synthase
MFKRKVTFKKWLDIMDEAWAHGMSSSASMMFGTYDGLDDRFEAEFCRLEHMDMLRQRQGQTSFYRAFVAWPYQPNQERIRDKAAPHEEYIRLMCMARLYMRNFPNLQSSYLSHSKEQFQDSLGYAVNCSGGILYSPELVTGSVGANPNDLSRTQIIDWINSAGYQAEERDYYGRILSDPYTGRSHLSNQAIDKV